MITNGVDTWDPTHGYYNVEDIENYGPEWKRMSDVVVNFDYGEQKKRPSFDLIQANYLGDDYTSAQVYEKIGGKVYQNYLSNPETYANSCALRMSYALNRAGATIPHIAGTGSGADGKWYFYRVADLGKYLNRTFGPPDLNGHDRSDFSDVQGIIQFDVSIWTDATGHFTTWDGSKVGHGDYFKESDNVHLWILPK